MSDRDPPRLSQDPATSGLLREAIRESKRDLPDDARLAAIALKLGAIGAAGGGGGVAAAGAGAAKASVAPAAVKAGASALSLKIAAAAAVTAVAIGGGVVVAPRVLAPKPAVTVAASTTIAAPTNSAPSGTAPSEFTLPPASASAAPAPTPSGVASTRANAPPPNPNEEMRNVGDARAILATDPARALAICNATATTFPKGQFVEDRETVAIEALAKLGRVDEAKARERKFEAQFPHSADLPVLHRVLGQP